MEANQRKRAGIAEITLPSKKRKLNDEGAMEDLDVPRPVQINEHESNEMH